MGEREVGIFGPFENSSALAAEWGFYSTPSGAKKQFRIMTSPRKKNGAHKTGGEWDERNSGSGAQRGGDENQKPSYGAKRQPRFEGSKKQNGELSL